LFNKSDRLADLKMTSPLSFMKTKYSSKLLGAHLISAIDKKSLLPLIDELEKRFWPS
jgi:GTP-binding protein HflX